MCLLVGLCIAPNGDYYIGNWIKSKKNGEGEIHYSNGDVFKGKFLNDKMHGKGTWQYAARDFDEESDGESNKSQKNLLVCKKYDNGKEVEIINKEKNIKKNKIEMFGISNIATKDVLNEVKKDGLNIDIKANYENNLKVQSKESACCFIF